MKDQKGKILYGVIVDKELRYLTDSDFKSHSERNVNNNNTFVNGFNSIYKNSRDNTVLSNNNTIIKFMKLANSGLEYLIYKKRMQPKTTDILDFGGISVFNDNYSINLASIIDVCDDEKIYLVSDNTKNFFVNSLLNSQNGIIKSYSSFWIDIYEEILDFSLSSKVSKTILDGNGKNNHFYFMTKNQEIFKARLLALLNDEKDYLRSSIAKKTPKEIKMENFFVNISPEKDFSNYKSQFLFQDFAFTSYLRELSERFKN